MQTATKNFRSQQDLQVPSTGAPAESQQTKPLTHEQRRLLLMANLRAFVFRLQHGAVVRREEITRAAELAEPEARA